MTEDTRRTIVVTGGSRGIGRAACVALADADSRIYFNYHSGEAAAQETVAAVADAGGEATALPMDQGDADQVAAFFKKVLDDTGRIDVLVNNAGITRDGLLVRMSDDQWDTVMDVNLKGVFRCTKLVAKTMMRQRSGRIINLTSVVGVTGNPGQANYVAAKAGIIGLTKAVAKELSSRGVTCNAVAPGFIETDMTGDLADAAKTAMLGQIPMGRAGSPEDVAAAIAFLASDAASYITGQTIHVNGGMFM